MQTLYARAIWLRNCGRFTHVSSDFGSLYHTHHFVTSEALYASLTRGETWRHQGRFIDLDDDGQKPMRADYFICDYDVARKPIWFTPGLFMDEQSRPLAKQRGVADKNDFNVVSEGYPSTGGDGRPSYVPTYGRIEAILPDKRLLAFVYSWSRDELDPFRMNQTFLMGKKRTMWQIVELSKVVQGLEKHGACNTWWLQISLERMSNFAQYEILAATMRYLMCRGLTHNKGWYVEFAVDGKLVCLPGFYLEETPLWKTGRRAEAMGQ